MPPRPAARLTAAMTAFPTNTLFVIESGGNDVTETRPYATATEAELDGLAEDYDAILAVMAARPGRCIMAPLTYREYANPATSSAMLIDGAAARSPITKRS